ncbi:DUF6241 domain-containing protein [Virgibacillus necropolis]|uniref:DUF6241 domain-containing protein n=1 Tax=Virgibacillus necropolis TaxID=163877 RepID=UPI00384C5793
MKNALIIIGCSVVVLGLVAWGTFTWLSAGITENTSGEKEKDAVVKELHENRKNIEGTITEEELTTFKEKELNPFGEETKLVELSDYMYQEYIHGMSHQKVQASKKWGFYEIHPSRITWLLEGLESVKLKHENIYRDILKKWNNGNFSSVDNDHNAVWRLQDGTVGIATGILSSEEEQAYVNSNSDS